MSFPVHKSHTAKIRFLRIRERYRCVSKTVIYQIMVTLFNNKYSSMVIKLKFLNNF